MIDTFLRASARVSGPVVFNNGGLNMISVNGVDFFEPGNCFASSFTRHARESVNEVSDI